MQKKRLEGVIGFTHKINGSIPAAGRADPASFSAIIKVGKGLRGFPEPHRAGIPSPIPKGWELLSALLPAWITQWGSLAQLSVWFSNSHFPTVFLLPLWAQLCFHSLAIPEMRDCPSSVSRSQIEEELKIPFPRGYFPSSAFPPNHSLDLSKALTLLNKNVPRGRSCCKPGMSRAAQTPIKPQPKSFFQETFPCFLRVLLCIYTLYLLIQPVGGEWAGAQVPASLLRGQQRNLGQNLELSLFSCPESCCTQVFQLQKIWNIGLAVLSQLESGHRSHETGKFPLQRAHPKQFVVPVFSLASREIAGSTNIPWHLISPCISGLWALHTKSGFSPREHQESPWFYWDSRNPQTARAGTCRTLMTKKNLNFKIFKAGKGLQFCLCLGIPRENRGQKYWTQFQRFDCAALGTWSESQHQQLREILLDLFYL